MDKKKWMLVLLLIFSVIFLFISCDNVQSSGVNFNIPERFRGTWKTTEPISHTIEISSSDIILGEQSMTEFYNVFGVTNFSQGITGENTYFYSVTYKGSTYKQEFVVTGNMMEFREYNGNQLTSTKTYTKVEEPGEEVIEPENPYADASRLSAMSYITANNIALRSDESISSYFSEEVFEASNGYQTVTRTVISEYTDTKTGVIFYPESTITATILKNEPNEFSAGLSRLNCKSAFSSTPNDMHQIIVDVPFGGTSTDGLVVKLDGEPVDNDEFMKIVIENTDMMI